MSWLLLVALGGAVFQPSDALTRARRMAETGKIQEAIHLLDARARTAPAAPELALLAELQAGVGAIPQAAATLERLLGLVPREHRLRTTRAAMLFELRRFEEARRELEVALEDAGDEGPETGLARYYLASIHKAEGELEAALEQAERAVAALPASRVFTLDAKPHPSAAARHLLAEIRHERGETPESLEPLLREVVELAPSFAPARYLLSRILLAAGQEGEAKQQLERFRRIKRAETYLELGSHLSGVEGNRFEAIAQLELAVRADPENARALVLLARELTFAGRSEEASAALERAVALRPETADWLRERSR